MDKLYKLVGIGDNGWVQYDPCGDTLSSTKLHWAISDGDNVVNFNDDQLYQLYDELMEMLTGF